MEEDFKEVSKRSFPVWLIIIIAVLLLGGLSVLGWWLYKQSKSKNTSTPATSGQDTNTSTADWQTYKSTNQGFSILIPPTWKQTESGVEGRASFSSADAPEGDAPPAYPVTHANIWTEPNSSNLSLQGVIDEQKNLYQSSAIKDFKLISEENVDINGVAGKKIVMSFTDLQTGLSHISGFACATKDAKIWKINFIASAQSPVVAQTVWDENSYLFDKMISAFIFL